MRTGQRKVTVRYLESYRHQWRCTALDQCVPTFRHRSRPFATGRIIGPWRLSYRHHLLSVLGRRWP